MKHLKTSTLFLVSALAFAGCGGGSSGGDAASPVTEESGESTVTFRGKVVDNYLQQATVCLDLENDGVCGDGDPTVLSDENGSYVLEANLSLEAYPEAVLLAYGGTDSATGETFASVLTAPVLDDDGEVDLSPLTTLVTESMESNDRAGLEEAVETVAQQLALDPVQVMEDPVALALEGESDCLETALQLQQSLEVLAAAEREGDEDEGNLTAARNVMAQFAKKIRTQSRTGVEALIDAATDQETTGLEKAKLVREAAKEMAKKVKEAAKAVRERKGDDSPLDAEEVAELQLASDVVNDALLEAIETMDDDGLDENDSDALLETARNYDLNAGLETVLAQGEVERLLEMIGYDGDDAEAITAQLSEEVNATLDLDRFEELLETLPLSEDLREELQEETETARELVEEASESNDGGLVSFMRTGKFTASFLIGRKLYLSDGTTTLTLEFSSSRVEAVDAAGVEEEGKYQVRNGVVAFSYQGLEHTFSALKVESGSVLVDWNRGAGESRVYLNESQAVEGGVLSGEETVEEEDQPVSIPQGETLEEDHAEDEEEEEEDQPVSLPSGEELEEDQNLSTGV